MRGAPEFRGGFFLLRLFRLDRFARYGSIGLCARFSRRFRVGRFACYAARDSVGAGGRGVGRRRAAAPDARRRVRQAGVARQQRGAAEQLPAVAAVLHPQSS